MVFARTTSIQTLTDNASTYMPAEDPGSLSSAWAQTQIPRERVKTSSPVGLMNPCWIVRLDILSLN